MENLLHGTLKKSRVKGEQDELHELMPKTKESNAAILKRPPAKIDLADIWDYIAEDNESGADEFIDVIDQKFHALAEQPAMG